MRARYSTGLIISLLRVSYCSFHMGYEWVVARETTQFASVGTRVLANVSMTHGKSCGENNYFVSE